jgi:putative ABC transport system substrate-binding protein
MMQTRRVFLRRVTLSALGAPIVLSACARFAAEPPPVPRIGFLSISSEISFRPFLVGVTPEEKKIAFLTGLADLGYRDGETIKIDYRWGSPGDLATLGPLADELVAIPDLRLIVAHANNSVVALQKRTKLPIVMVNASDPVESGFVESLAQPGGNITGMVISNGPMTAKRVELLKEIAPGITTIGFAAPANTSTIGRNAAIAAAKDLGLRIEMLDLRSVDELENVFRKAVDAGVQGIVTGGDGFNQDNEKRILALLLRYRLPAIHYFRSYTDDGGIATLKQAPGLFGASAKYVDRILKGASPATLPIETWAGSEMIVNPAGARALGVELPATVIARATEVVR